MKEGIHMKLSILDQAPISAGQSAKEALDTSMELASLGDQLGYNRYWVAEHHDLFGLASPNPAVMLGAIGAKTNKIRIGAGAVLLPYYKPFHIAETYNLLATMYPDRIDLGLGRAPGGSAEVSIALSDNYLKEVRKFSDDVEELNHFLNNSFPEDHMYKKISPTPIPVTAPQAWLLGTSEKSAILAAETGMNYCFGDFMTEYNGPKIVQTFRDHWYKRRNSRPYVVIAVNVMCAEDSATAEKLLQSQLVWKIKQDKLTADTLIPAVENAELYRLTVTEEEKVARMKRNIISGNPKEVVQQLTKVQKSYQADELMIVTITHDKKDKFNSYQLIMDQIVNARTDK